MLNINSQYTYEKRWKRYCNSNEIPRIPLYSTRHTLVSMVKNLPEGTIKTVIGHSKDMDTFGIYREEIDREMQDTARIISETFEKVLEVKK